MFGWKSSRSDNEIVLDALAEKIDQRNLPLVRFGSDHRGEGLDMLDPDVGVRVAFEARQLGEVGQIRHDHEGLHAALQPVQKLLQLIGEIVDSDPIDQVIGADPDRSQLCGRSCALRNPNHHERLVILRPDQGPAISFGSLGAKSIEALNLGAAKGGFYHDSGEGAVSRYHTIHGGDLVWELGSGYFGCRSRDGLLDAGASKEQASLDQIKMIEIKLSQGTKPGHGGMLPGEKVTDEIAEARRVPVGTDCISPAYHTAFSTPRGLLAFAARLRDLAGGKLVGIKLCVGRPYELFAIMKAML